MDEQQNGKEIRILCVEDTEDDFEIISHTLEKTLKEKYLLKWASTAKKGLTLLETHEFDIMLLDYNLPDMNGIEMMKAMRYEGVTIPIILLTGQGDEMVAVNAMKEGAADYITKSDIVGKDTLANAIVHIVAMFDFLLDNKSSKKNIGKRRDTISILSSLLHHSVNGIGKTQLVYKANLNFKTIKKYLSFLLSNDFLSVHIVDDKELFRTSPQGMKLLRQLKEIEEYFD